MDRYKSRILKMRKDIHEHMLTPKDAFLKVLEPYHPVLLVNPL